MCVHFHAAASKAVHMRSLARMTATASPRQIVQACAIWPADARKNPATKVLHRIATGPWRAS